MCQVRSGRWMKAPMLSSGSHPCNGGSCASFIFYSTVKCISSHIKKPRGRQQCNIRALVPYIRNSLVFFYSVYSISIPCWFHPQVCSMMVQGIMSRYGNREEERWPSFCDSLEGKKLSPKPLDSITLMFHGYKWVTWPFLNPWWPGGRGSPTPGLEPSQFQ